MERIDYKRSDVSEASLGGAVFCHLVDVVPVASLPPAGRDDHDDDFPPRIAPVSDRLLHPGVQVQQAHRLLYRLDGAGVAG
jgi:hypothetical protein